MRQRDFSAVPFLFRLFPATTEECRGRLAEASFAAG
jgi:hypothetical protein